jgi:hypothetical protein
MVSKSKIEVIKEDANIYCPLAKRIKAIGALIGDPIIDNLASEAESLYNPKKVQTKHDWLACRKERGQTYDEYKQGSPDISWVNKRFNTILMVMLDNSVPVEMQNALLNYCTAFFTGCDVKLKRPGELWQG